MTYEQIVAMMQTYYVNADASMTTGHYAVQVNVIGEGEGAFYIEMSEGKVSVEPYDYVDRNAAVNTTAEILKTIADGKVSYTEAVEGSTITIEGDQQAAAVLDSIKLAVKEVIATAAEEEVAKTAPVAEEAAVVETVPVAEEAAVVESAPVAEEAAVVESAPAAEESAAKKTAAKTSAKKAPARKRAVSKANAKNAKAGKKNSK